LCDHVIDRLPRPGWHGIRGHHGSTTELATLDTGGAEITSVSCASPGNCGAGGAYEDGSSHQQAFVDSQG
jgi:hypothetical protein